MVPGVETVREDYGSKIKVPTTYSVYRIRFRSAQISLSGDGVDGDLNYPRTGEKARDKRRTESQRQRCARAEMRAEGRASSFINATRARSRAGVQRLQVHPPATRNCISR